MSTESRARLYECLGGPLCGTKVEDPFDSGRMVWVHEDGRPHFYRLLEVSRKDGSKATFFHYFGNSIERAQEAIPTMRPPERLFRKKKKK